MELQGFRGVESSSIQKQRRESSKEAGTISERSEAAGVWMAEMKKPRGIGLRLRRSISFRTSNGERVMEGESASGSAADVSAMRARSRRRW
jgi:DNA helicase TIP49 (TBP-interacting protein)